MNCGEFTCGSDAHNQLIGFYGGNGCGKNFRLDEAPFYLPDQNRLNLSYRKIDEERTNLLKYQADSLLWEQLQQKTLPTLLCRFTCPPGYSGSLVPCTIFSDKIRKETSEYSILLYVVENSPTIIHLDILPHFIELYMWLQSTFSGFLSEDEASTLKMKTIMSEEKLKKYLDVTTRKHLLWLWDEVKSGYDGLVSDEKFHIYFGCEEIRVSFTNIEEASLYSLMSSKDATNGETDYLFLTINQLIET